MNLARTTRLVLVVLPMLIGICCNERHVGERKNEAKKEQKRVEKRVVKGAEEPTDPTGVSFPSKDTPAEPRVVIQFHGDHFGKISYFQTLGFEASVPVKIGGPPWSKLDPKTDRLLIFGYPPSVGLIINLADYINAGGIAVRGCSADANEVAGVRLGFMAQSGESHHRSLFRGEFLSPLFSGLIVGTIDTPRTWCSLTFNIPTTLVAKVEDVRTGGMKTTSGLVETGTSAAKLR